MKTIHVDSTTDNLSSVMGFINSELDELGCPERIRAQIKLAIDELFGNICFYAYEYKDEQNILTFKKYLIED